MITINIPELHKLNRIKARPNNPDYHPPTKQFGLKNIEFPTIGRNVLLAINSTTD